MGMGMPSLRFSPMRYRQFFFGEADFFSAKRLFFRVARDVSGVRSSPPWAASGDRTAKTRFRLYTHSPAHDRALALTSPPPDFLFSSIHHPPSIPQSHQSHQSHQSTIPAAEHRRRAVAKQNRLCQFAAQPIEKFT